MIRQESAKPTKRTTSPNLLITSLFMRKAVVLQERVRGDF